LTFDVSAVRALYPALADGHAYLDGAAGTQVPVPVIDAIAAAYRVGIGNLGGAFAASHRSDSIVEQARAAVADLVGGTADGVVFGPSATALAYRMCLAARGLIDFAVSAENSHDWDIAAADLLLEESGARLIDASGERLRYNSRQVRRGALLAASDAAAPRLVKGFRAATGSSSN